MAIRPDDNNTKHQGNFRVTSVAGTTAGDLTVNGIGARDILNSVVATTEGDISTEFALTAANTINNATGSDTTGETVTVSWYAQP